MPTTVSTSKRRKRADLKDLVMTAGLEVLERDGIGVGAEDLTYAKVFDHLEQTTGVRVTRGSVHERIWDSQRDFQLDVLATVAEWDFVSSIDDTRSLIEAAAAEADLSTHAGRAEAMRFLLRVAPMQNLRHSETVDKWSLWHGTVSSVLSHPSDDESVAVVREAASTSYRKLFEAWTRLYFDTGLMLGFTIRQIPGLTHEQLVEKWTSMVLAMADGFAIRMGADLVETFELPTGPNGELETWDDFGFAMWQAIPSYMENPAD